MIGAGSKCLAIAAKQAVLRRPGVAAPEKDIGFLYDSRAWSDTARNRAVHRPCLAIHGRHIRRLLLAFQSPAFSRLLSGAALDPRTEHARETPKRFGYTACDLVVRTMKI